MPRERPKNPDRPSDNDPTTSRRAFGALALGLGTGLSNITGLLASSTRRHNADENNRAQGRAQTQGQISASAVEQALANADEHSVVRPQSGVIEPTSTLTIPDWITLDASNITIRPQHTDDVISCGARGRIFRGLIEMGSSGAIGVLNDSAVGDSYAHKWGGGAVGTVITATPGSGATGHEIRKPPGADNNFYQCPAVETHGVDTPVRIRSQGSDGFITSVNAGLIATDFRQAVVVDGDRNCSNCLVRHNLRPSRRSERVKLIDGPVKRFVTEGSISDPSQLDDIIRIEETFKTDNGTAVGTNAHLSYEGLSSEERSGLVVVNTDIQAAQVAQVIDFSDVWRSRSQSNSGSRSRSESRSEVAVAQQQRGGAAIVAEPGEFQSALDDGAAEGRLVRCANGEQFDLDDVRAPAGVTIDARGAMFSLSGGGVGISFESGATMIGGYVDVSEDDDVAFRVEAGAGETISGPTGPLQVFVDGRPDGSSCTGLLLHAHDGGTIDGIQALVRTFRCETVLDVHAERGGAIRDCDVFTTGGQSTVCVDQRGQGEQAWNTWFVHNQPDEETSRAQWHVDAPNAHDEWCEGYLWDGDKMVRPWIVHIERAAGNIRYANPQTREQGESNEHFKFIDETDGDGNRPIAFPLLDPEDVDTITVPYRRCSTWRFASTAANQLSA
jgi:hypothetical protein